MSSKQAEKCKDCAERDNCNKKRIEACAIIPMFATGGIVSYEDNLALISSSIVGSKNEIKVSDKLTFRSVMHNGNRSKI